MKILSVANLCLMTLIGLVPAGQALAGEVALEKAPVVAASSIEPAKNMALVKNNPSPVAIDSSAQLVISPAGIVQNGLTPMMIGNSVGYIDLNGRFMGLSQP